MSPTVCKSRKKLYNRQTYRPETTSALQMIQIRRVNLQHPPWDRLLWWCHTLSAAKHSGACWATALRGVWYWSTSPWLRRNPCRWPNGRVRLRIVCLCVPVPCVCVCVCNHLSLSCSGSCSSWVCVAPNRLTTDSLTAGFFWPAWRDGCKWDSR